VKTLLALLLLISVPAFSQSNNDIILKEKNFVCNGNGPTPASSYRMPTNPSAFSYPFNFGQGIAQQNPNYGRPNSGNTITAAGPDERTTEFNTLYPNSLLDRVQKRLMTYCNDVVRNYPASYRNAEQLLTHMTTKCVEFCGANADVCARACHIGNTQTANFILGMRQGRENCMKEGNEQLQNCESMREQASIKINQSARGMERVLTPANINSVPINSSGSDR
jgi:hypothetical protein